MKGMAIKGSSLTKPGSKWNSLTLNHCEETPEHVLHKASLLSRWGLAEGCEAFSDLVMPPSLHLALPVWVWLQQPEERNMESSSLLSASVQQLFRLVGAGVLWRIWVAAICGNVTSDQQLIGSWWVPQGSLSVHLLGWEARIVECPRAQAAAPGSWFGMLLCHSLVAWLVGSYLDSREQQVYFVDDCRTPRRIPYTKGLQKGAEPCNSYS